MSTIITEPFADSTAGKRGKELQRRRFRGCCSNDDGVLHGIALLQGLDELCHGRSFLTNCDIDAVELLGLIIGVVPPSLVQNGIECDGRLSSLTITNDKLTLTTTDRHHRIYGFETSLDGLIDRLSGQDARCLELGSVALSRLDRPLAVNRIAESIDNAAQHRRSNRDIDLLSVSGDLDRLLPRDEQSALSFSHSRPL